MYHFLWMELSPNIIEGWMESHILDEYVYAWMRLRVIIHMW
jgi:hypothetical protein